MPLPEIANVVRVAWEGRCSNGQPWVNVLHVRKLEATAWPAAIVDIEAYMDALWLTYDQIISNDVTLDRRRYTPLDGSSASTIITQSLAGTATDESVPPHDAVCVSHYTALRGPRYRGRTYLPQTTRGFVAADGSFSTAGAASIAAGFDTFREAIEDDADLDAFVVASYKFSTAEQVLSSICNIEFDTQRRRRLSS